MTEQKQPSVWRRILKRALNIYGEFFRILLAPAFAPLFKEMFAQQRRIAEIMLDYNHYYTDENGFVKQREDLTKDNDE